MEYAIIALSFLLGVGVGFAICPPVGRVKDKLDSFIQTIPPRDPPPDKK